MMNEDLEKRIEKLEKESHFMKLEEKIVNFSLALLSVSLSVFVIGTLIVSCLKIYSGYS